MKKFDEWNKVKKRTEKEITRYYTVREIWWCRLGVNVGTEQDGKGENFLRPVIIMRSFGPDACLIIPLTTSKKEHPLRISVGKIDKEDAKANLSQIKVIDTRRLVEKVGFLDKDIFFELRKNIKNLF